LATSQPLFTDIGLALVSIVGYHIFKRAAISWELMFATKGIFGSDFSNEAFHEDCNFLPEVMRFLILLFNFLTHLSGSPPPW